MKLRIKKYFKFGRFPFYNIEVEKDGHWLTICETSDDNKELAYSLKSTCKEFLENGGKCWSNN